MLLRQRANAGTPMNLAHSKMIVHGMAANIQALGDFTSRAAAEDRPPGAGFGRSRFGIP